MKPDAALHRLVIDRIANEAIGVSVLKGVVTLNGIVHTYAERDDVAAAVLRIPGVLDVANDLEVRPSWQTHLSNPEIAAAVRAALAADPAVPHEHIQVTVEPNGHVTLAGDVRTRAEALAAERAIRDLDGVYWVVDRLRTLEVERV